MPTLAITAFIGLFIFGSQLLGWSDQEGHIRLALVLAFVLGGFFGYKMRS